MENPSAIEDETPGGQTATLGDPMRGSGMLEDMPIPWMMKSFHQPGAPAVKRSNGNST